MVARSSAEAKFKAVANEICEVQWIRRILKDLKIKSHTPMEVYCDNKVTISILHKLVLHDKTKHVVF